MHKLIPGRHWLLALFLVVQAFIVAHAATQSTTTDWGEIGTSGETTIAFSGVDKTTNFTDQYTFSIAGSADASYAVTVTFDFCKTGCGNPDTNYGIYDLNGNLVSNSGSAVLTSGDYVFKVKATGMGAGNTLDYSGSITLFVSAVPEPADYLLFAVGSAVLWFAVQRQRRRMLKPLAAMSSGHSGRLLCA